MMMLIAIAAAALAAAAPVRPQEPGAAKWIWGSWSDGGTRPLGETCVVRREIDLPDAPKNATLHIAGDNHFRLFINGRFVGGGDDWMHPRKLRIAPQLRKGANEIVVEGRNDTGPAALILFGDVECADGRRVRVESNAEFQAAPGALDAEGKPSPAAAAWRPAKEFAAFGEGVWQGVTLETELQFEVPEGFAVETLADGFGSAVALALDGDGRPIVSIENSKILRLLDRDGDGVYESEEVVSESVRGCHGLCWSRGSLFAVGDGPGGMGLYRLDDAGRAGPKQLIHFGADGGEHGPHGVVEGPDGLLYVAVGNHATPPDATSPNSPYAVYYEGHPLPRFVDPLGHATHVRAPGGTIVAVDRDGRECRVVAGGFRNHYDLAFARNGRCYTYDSDMEWDLGLPWYRPTRLLEVVPGGEYGWRTGSTVWPEYYEDSLPPLVNAGRGSPTGLVVYEAGRFPARFDGAVLGGDWSQGRIVAFERDAAGAFARDPEWLVSGRPLNVTDLAVDAQGRLLFVTGGRGTHGGLYRLDYKQSAPRAAAAAPANRRPSLADAPAMSADEIAAGLASPDRVVRFLAGRAYERLPETAKSSIRPAGEPAEAEILLARARLHAAGKSASDPTAPNAAARLVASADATARGAALRAAELMLLDASPGDTATLAAALEHAFPTGRAPADREIALLLARLGTRAGMIQLLDALAAEPSREMQIHYAYCLRAIAVGWTPETRARFASWLVGTAQWNGGDSFRGYLEDIADAFRKLMPADEKKDLDARLKKAEAPSAAPPVQAAIARDPDRVWTYVERTRNAPRRSGAEGAAAFRTLCGRCHVYAGEGSSIGPDLSSVAARFTRREIFESIVEPSKQISDQYRSWAIEMKDGTAHAGLITREDADSIVLLDSGGARTTLAKINIAERVRSAVSHMPSGLLDSLTLEQCGDLLQFLEKGAASGAKPSAPWAPLFTASTLDGWSGDPALWRREGDSVVGVAQGLPSSSFLISNGEHADFSVEAEVRVLEGNSGLQFRSKRLDGFRVAGYQADLGQEYWGSLYEEGGRGTLSQPAPEIRRSAVDPHGWNHLFLEAHGDRIRIEINGLRTSELRDAQAASGVFGIQLHAGLRTEVAFRMARIREDAH